MSGKESCKQRCDRNFTRYSKNGRNDKQIVKSTKLPVTVKTRLGWDENTKHIVEAERLQDVGIKVYINTWEN